MSKRIFLPLWFSTLLGACALNTGPMAAQAAGGLGSPPENAAAPVVASLNAPQPSDAAPPTGNAESATDEMEPDAPAEASPPAAEAPAGPPPLPPCPVSAASLDSRIAGQICQRVRTEPPLTRLTVDGRALHSLESTIRFYVEREYRAGWLAANGSPSPAAEELLKVLAEADQEG